MDNAQGAPGSEKRPWVAAVLSALLPGLGHLYSRMWGRAVFWFALALVATRFFMPGGAVPGTLSADALLSASSAVPVEVVFVVFSISALNVFDAYLMTLRRNHHTSGDEESRSCPNCGKNLDTDLEFCHWCTTRLDDEQHG